MIFGCGPRPAWSASASTRVTACWRSPGFAALPVLDFLCSRRSPDESQGQVAGHGHRRARVALNDRVDAKEQQADHAATPATSLSVVRGMAELKAGLLL